ncbi:MAG: 4-hydroxybutyryl-CoA dehydratase/vinylacetyl-CoA-Delta-isomerase [Acidimicrobiales bacterium]|nr:MAG: gamma-aminobutyrate dehydratase [Actinomycetota bacterium]MBV6509191.1 4-hydroxybutyryl-CoA dehydratase/vinylacetyl-CoA-Delta-isomerase [Acidimicrobiales bacterium]RIK08464.1 MAG: gamma-aminobutyrate dehydratase [Acidobacteriota bacterium]
MALRSADEYRAALKDGRSLYYRGRSIPDICAEPDLRVAVDHAAIDYELAHDPAHRELTVDIDEQTGEEYSSYYRLPRNGDDLLHRSKLIETVTAAGGTMVTLIKEIGSDGLFSILRLLEGDKLERAEAFYRHCRNGDLAVAVAQTDVKGDRSLPPHAQPDPDMYVHVVDESSDGIVVRGAKCHTSIGANADEIIVFPTRAMGADDIDYSLAFAVPANAPGVNMYISGYSAGEHDEFEFPLSSRHKMLETLTVFDDVFVPWDRVFVYKEPELAGRLALTFVEYHRFTAVSYKLPLVDLLVGASALIADLNGVGKAKHIREKLTQLVIFAEKVRALTHMAAIRARVGGYGLAYPDPLTTNLAKYTFATGYHEMLELVQDCAGGLLVTGPGGPDWHNPEIRTVLEKYYRAAGTGEERLRVMNLIADLTVRDFGGYHAVLAVHAEGSIEAEKMQILRSYDARGPLAYARHLAGLET